jgi:hypothetical protein
LVSDIGGTDGIEMSHLVFLHGQLRSSLDFIRVGLACMDIPQYQPAAFRPVRAITDLEQFAIGQASTICWFRFQAIKNIEAIVSVVTFRKKKFS